MGDGDVLKTTYLVIGGGIAGVTCVETLADQCPKDSILLITASPLVKAVVNYNKLSRTLETFDVEEKPSSTLAAQCPNVKVLQTFVSSLQGSAKVVVTSCGKRVHYDKLCICTGGKPKLIPGEDPHIVGIRDTESVQDFQKKLRTAKRIVVVGNGGIATELVHEVEGCEVIWAIKDRSIASTFVDEGAAQFFLPHLNQERKEKEGNAPVKRLQYTLEQDLNTEPEKQIECLGSALGPDWAARRLMTGNGEVREKVHVEYGVEVAGVMTPLQMTQSQRQATTPPTLHCHPQHRWPVYVELTNNTVYGCDLIVSATGVTPYSDPFTPGNALKACEEGGLVVDEKLRTSLPDVFAAGDVCTATWEHDDLWHQMRLWTQARQMGFYAARSMAAARAGEEISLDICFELFAHVTKFFGYKVVLIGLFNAQGLGTDYELLLRVTPGEEYVKVVLQGGRLVGAILIGDTDLEETFENLALNKTDLTPFKDHLLDPNIDIDDFFD